jgi:hypothetical protein
MPNMKFVCDDITSDELHAIASIVCSRFRFRETIALSEEGAPLSDKLKAYGTRSHLDPLLFVDAVATTGRTFRKFEEQYSDEGIHPIGVCIIARRRVPNWVHPILFYNPLWTDRT